LFSWFYWRLWAGTTESPGWNRGAIHSVAVLPFENASGDPNADYLSDGLAETLIE
jgi:TolB-like protein